VHRRLQYRFRIFYMNELLIESLDQEGRGITHCDGKAIFVEGALPGERVVASVYKKKPRYEVAVVSQVLKSSAARAVPSCAYYGICGGCSWQHIDLRTQVAAKQRVLEDTLRHIGNVDAEQILPAIHGPGWRYRHRARFSVRYVPKKGGVLVGFHEKRRSYVADMKTCEVLPSRISALLEPLRRLVAQLSIKQRVPQIELAIGDRIDVLVFRILQPLSDNDQAVLRSFADEHRVQLYLQRGGPETATAFYPQNAPEIAYSLPEFDVTIGFAPTDFTQVNEAINRVLVRRAMSLLDPQPGEAIADLFCGVGNFSLPIARSGAVVVGIEGSERLVTQARRNAERNGLSHRARFLVQDLFRMDQRGFSALGRLDAVLIDPPRDGAIEVVKALEIALPRRIVYVSCNPATLARDAGVLVHTLGYRLHAAGVVNMFPHTAHVESVAVFRR
jgi:23S rRNA (uracil1939-C5)-methyltransferase